jgi:5-hydroxyisourate hydrolase
VLHSMLRNKLDCIHLGLCRPRKSRLPQAPSAMPVLALATSLATYPPRDLMGLSTHVLDTMHGCPAAGMPVRLYSTQNGLATLVQALTLNADGRNPAGALIATESMQVGTYRLVFCVAAYFRARGVDLPQPPFLDEVPIDFGIAQPAQHYHVPLLCSPWAYSTYRGS